MFKWFAPLLLLAGKPDLLIRLVAAVIAAAVLFFGVWLLSNIALTFDALKNPYIAAVYGLFLLCFFIGVGTVGWLQLRRLSPAPKLPPPRPEPEVALPQEIVSRRAEDIANAWERGNRQLESKSKAAARLVPATAPPPEPTPSRPPARATLTVTGPAYAGKTDLIAALVQTTSSAAAEATDIVRLVDAGPIDGDDRHLAALVTGAAATDGVVFVVDQDLRAPEVAAIKRLMTGGKPLYLVLNKADQFNAADRDTILVSMRAKMPGHFAPGDVVSVAAAPSPVERQIEDARGAVRVELRRPSSDLRGLTNLLSRVFASAPGRALRFEAELSAKA
ncbi:MAG: hypothetical protein WAK63_16240 [Xanthobacteraceae bacterium]